MIQPDNSPPPSNTNFELTPISSMSAFYLEMVLCFHSLMIIWGPVVRPFGCLKGGVCSLIICQEMKMVFCVIMRGEISL